MVGSLAPRTGGAHRYGADIHEASRLAVADFNYYLEKRGEPWRLEPVRSDLERVFLDLVRGDGAAPAGGENGP